MKKFLVIILLSVLIGVSVYADNFKAPSKQKIEWTDSTTTHTYEISNVIHDIFKSRNGSFYIWKTSKKTGKKYKYYLPKEIQIKLGRKYNNNNK